MKNCLVLIALAVVGLAGAAHAQCNPDPNEIGIFWSEDCGECVNCIQFIGGIITAYVVLANVTQPGGVYGYEFCVVDADGSSPSPPSGSIVLLTYHFPPGGINVWDPPCFAVGLNQPIPWSPCITLLRIDMLVIGPEPWCFGVGPTDLPAIPGHMAYADGADPGNLLIMHPNTGPGATDFAMACINDPLCPPYPVDLEAKSWGTLKSLYR